MLLLLPVVSPLSLRVSAGVVSSITIHGTGVLVRYRRIIYRRNTDNWQILYMDSSRDRMPDGTIYGMITYHIKLQHREAFG